MAKSDKHLHSRYGGLIQQVRLAVPTLPQSLVGLSILHISDLHVRRSRHIYETLLKQLRKLEVDIVTLGGDYMDKRGDEPASSDLIGQLIATIRPRLGFVGVWGNHDSADLRQQLARMPIRWLCNQVWRVESLPLVILGLACQSHERSASSGDLLTTMLNEQLYTGDEPMRLLLSHLPTWLPAAGDANISLVLSGHTHGGQVRAPLIGPLINATPGWPLQYTSGVMRYRQTLAVISRGVGETTVDGLRFFCPPHVPLITLYKDETDPPPATEIQMLAKW